MSAKIIQLHEFRDKRLCNEIKASVEYLTSDWDSNEDIDLNAITVATDVLFSMYSDSVDDDIESEWDEEYEEQLEKDMNFDYKEYWK